MMTIVPNDIEDYIDELAELPRTELFYDMRVIKSRKDIREIIYGWRTPHGPLRKRLWFKAIDIVTKEERKKWEDEI